MSSDVSTDVAIVSQLYLILILLEVSSFLKLLMLLLKAVANASMYTINTGIIIDSLHVFDILEISVTLHNDIS